MKIFMDYIFIYLFFLIIFFKLFSLYMAKYGYGKSYIMKFLSRQSGKFIYRFMFLVHCLNIFFLFDLVTKWLILPVKVWVANHYKVSWIFKGSYFVRFIWKLIGIIFIPFKIFWTALPKFLDRSRVEVIKGSLLSLFIIYTWFFWLGLSIPRLYLVYIYFIIYIYIDILVGFPFLKENVSSWVFTVESELNKFFSDSTLCYRSSYFISIFWELMQKPEILDCLYRYRYGQLESYGLVEGSETIRTFFYTELFPQVTDNVIDEVWFYSDWFYYQVYDNLIIWSGDPRFFYPFWEYTLEELRAFYFENPKWINVCHFEEEDLIFIRDWVEKFRIKK